MNNLISNIEKYAAKDKPIELEVLYTDTYVELGFRNKIIKPNPYVKGTGIGLKNIELMMEQMKGFSMVEIIEDIYYIKLSFLIARWLLIKWMIKGDSVTGKTTLLQK